MNLLGRVAVVTGASRGIGYQIVKDLVAKDIFVYAIARDFSSFDLDGNIEKIEYDLLDIKNIGSLVDKIGDIDILINNAGVMNSIFYDNYPEDKINDLINLNVRVPVELINLFSKSMINKKSGRIVNIGSVAGLIGHPDVWYGISKAAIINLTKSYARLLGPGGVVINCVAPSVVDTDMMKIIPEERKDQILNSTLTHRFATPSDISKTVVWLATESPDYINGVCIDINNGSYMR